MKNEYFREQLWLAFEARAERNDSYSMTAFARDLGLGRSSLSLVMNKKRGVSMAMAKKMALRLGLNATQRQLFLNSVLSQSSRIPAMKKKAIRNPFKMNRSVGAPIVQGTNRLNFSVTWRHMALRELIALKDFRPDKNWLAIKLSTSAQESLRIWQDCINAGWIKAGLAGSYQAEEHISLKGEKANANQSAKNMYKELMSEVITKVDAPREERDLSAITLALSKDQFEELKKTVQLFNSELSRNLKISDQKEKTMVISWSTQICKIC